PELEVVGQHPHVERRVLLGGEGVHVAADGVDRLCDLTRLPAIRALEQQVLEEVRRPRRVTRLVTRAGADPEAGRHRGQLAPLLGDDRQAGRQPAGADFAQRRPPRRGLRRGPPPPPPLPLPPPPPARRAPPASTGPRSPNCSAASFSKKSSNDALELAPPDEAAGADDRLPPPPSAASPLPPPVSGRGSGASPASERETLPCGSMSSTRTSRSSPRSTTSSTLSMRLPWPSLLMWIRPSRPGRMLTNAPNLVMLTTLPV